MTTKVSQKPYPFSEDKNPIASVLERPQPLVGDFVEGWLKFKTAKLSVFRSPSTSLIAQGAHETKEVSCGHDCTEVIEYDRNGTKVKNTRTTKDFAGTVRTTVKDGSDKVLQNTTTTKDVMGTVRTTVKDGSDKVLQETTTTKDVMGTVRTTVKDGNDRVLQNTTTTKDVMGTVRTTVRDRSDKVLQETTTTKDFAGTVRTTVKDGNDRVLQRTTESGQPSQQSINPAEVTLAAKRAMIQRQVHQQEQQHAEVRAEREKAQSLLDQARTTLDPVGYQNVQRILTSNPSEFGLKRAQVTLESEKGRVQKERKQAQEMTTHIEQTRRSFEEAIDIAKAREQGAVLHAPLNQFQQRAMEYISRGVREEREQRVALEKLRTMSHVATKLATWYGKRYTGVIDPVVKMAVEKEAEKIVDRTFDFLHDRSLDNEHNLPERLWNKVEQHLNRLEKEIQDKRAQQQVSTQDSQRGNNHSASGVRDHDSGGDVRGRSSDENDRGYSEEGHFSINGFEISVSRGPNGSLIGRAAHIGLESPPFSSPAERDAAARSAIDAALAATAAKGESGGKGKGSAGSKGNSGDKSKQKQ